MKLTPRRVTVGLISTAVVVSMTSVTTWALAADKDAKVAAASSSPVRLIIGYKAGADRAAANRAMSAAGAIHTAGAASSTALAAINAASVKVSKERSGSMISSLRSDPNVAYVETDVQTKAFDTIPTDPSFKLQNEMYVVQAPTAWDTTKGGTTGPTVAVIDTGVNAVKDLAGATVAGYDFVNNDASPADDAGHGTSVAALIAARGGNKAGMAGVCWTCKIMPVKVLDSTGSGWDSDVAQGIIWAVQKGARILNLSLGQTQSTKVLQDAVAYANMNGALVVAAAGNEGGTPRATQRQYPAAYADVLTVAATQRCPAFATTPSCTTNTTKLTDFSSFNSSADTWVDVAAPGNVLSMDRFGNYSTGIEGTSFSSPIVAGAAALIKAQNPSYTGWSLANAIYKGAAAHKVTGGKINYGLIDIPASLAIPTDKTAATLSGIVPATGSIKRGTFAVSPVSLTDPADAATGLKSGIRNTTLWVNGKFVGYSRNAPFGVSFNFSSYKGSTKIELRVFDKAGNYKIVTNTVTIDNTKPAVRITSAPKSGSKITATKVTIGYTGSDTYGIARYELLLNGKVAQTHTSTAAFAFGKTAVPAKFTVQVRAYDKAGNSALSTKYSYTR